MNRAKNSNPLETFDGNKAYEAVKYQVDLGPRIPGSSSHSQAVDWMLRQLKEAGWSTEVQESVVNGHPIRNVVGGLGQGHPWVILGAHYDSRLAADRDPSPENWTQPVPGANDGASGVAVLLELARILPRYLEKEANFSQIWIVFFDAEDNGKIPGWDWIMGSRQFVEELKSQPEAAIIIDMIGDQDLNIYQERRSDQGLTQEIWAAAGQLGYAEQFIPQKKYSILDDHVPFLDAGIRAVDIFDFDYPYYHTLADTPDKVSAKSLKIVGDTLLSWLTKPR